MTKQLKVYAFVERAGATRALYWCDLIFTDHGPAVVFEWEGDRPVVTAALDTSLLQAPQAGAVGDYVYDGIVTDPRPMH